MGLFLKKRNLGSTTGLFKKKNGFDQTLCSYFFETGHRINFGDSYDSILAGTQPKWTMLFAMRKINNNSTNRYIFNKYLGSGNQRQILARFNNSQEIQVFISSDGTGANTAQLRGSTNFSNNNLWLLMILKFDGTQAGLDKIEMKVNDVDNPMVLDAGNFNADIFNSNRSFILGGDDGGSTNFEGYINQHGIINRVTTAAEDTLIYNGGSYRKFNDVLTDMNHYYSYDTDTFGTDWTVFDEAGAIDGTSAAMAAVDRDCNENPYQ